MRNRNFPPKRAAFTLAELMVAAAASTLIMAALVVAMVSGSRVFKATEVYSRAQAAQIRLIDAIALDLRRSVAVAITTSPSSTPGGSGNTTTKFSYDPNGDEEQNSRDIQDGTFDRFRNRIGGASAPSTYLTLKLPNFYRNNSPSHPDFQRAIPLISTRNAVRYGTSTGAAGEILVEYRQAFVPQLASECFIRREAGVDRIIAERTELFDVELTAQPEETFVVKSWFTPSFSSQGHMNSARVTSSDRVMLRNPRID